MLRIFPRFVSVPVLQHIRRSESVQERLDTMREQSLVGGGQNRIDFQHSKVPDALWDLCV